MSGPKTRVETYLAALSGENVTLPKPISRIDRYLHNLCQSGVGGVSDYTKLTNKPTETVGGDTLTWDGNTEGLVCLEGMLYKVSDASPSEEDLSNGFTVTFLDGITGTQEDFTIIQWATDVIALTIGDFPVIVSVLSGGVGVEIDGASFPESGLYYTDLAQIGFPNRGHISSFTIPGYTGFTKEVLKEEVLPGAVVFATDGTYLYNTADMSNPSNRTTMAQLRDTLLSGRTILIGGEEDGGTVYYLADCVSFTPEGFGFVMVSTPGNSAAAGFFTAEYVPE